MSDTTFTDEETTIIASWANDINDFVYRATAIGTQIAHLQSDRSLFWIDILGTSDIVYDVFSASSLGSLYFDGFPFGGNAAVFSYPYSIGMHIVCGGYGGWFVRSTQTYTSGLPNETRQLVAPVNYPRIDRYVRDEADASFTYIQGTEDPSPVPPAIPAGTIPMARVNLYVGMTEVTQQDIVDERTPYII